MWEVQQAEENARLLLNLKEGFKAKGLGSISGFFEVPAKWRCPCCLRGKHEMARLDRNENLLCALHWHHDHFIQCFTKQIREHFGYGEFQTVEASLVRFPNTLICNDCNVAEPYAKNLVNAPEAFSFAPYEIASFITVANNAPHQVVGERVQIAYDAAVPAMKMLSQRLREIRASIGEDLGDWEQAGVGVQPIMRMIKNMRAANE